MYVSINYLASLQSWPFPKDLAMLKKCFSDIIMQELEHNLKYCRDVFSISTAQSWLCMALLQPISCKLSVPWRGYRDVGQLGMLWRGRVLPLSCSSVDTAPCWAQGRTLCSETSSSFWYLWTGVAFCSIFHTGRASFRDHFFPSSKCLYWVGDNQCEYI